jgi:hypothetical protein
VIGLNRQYHYQKQGDCSNQASSGSGIWPKNRPYYCLADLSPARQDSSPTPQDAQQAWQALVNVRGLLGVEKATSQVDGQSIEGL